jgi:holin (3TMs family)
MPAFDPVTVALELGGKLADHFFPDATKAAEAKERLAAMAQNGQLAELTADTSLAQAQINVNLQDAKSEHWWQYGWRPAIGWVCVSVLGLSYIPKAIALTAFWSYQCYLLFAHPDVKLPAMPPFPDLGVTDVLGLLGTLLGAGWMAKLRTDEKKLKS